MYGGGGYDEKKYWEFRHRKYNSGFRTVATSSEDEFQRYPKQKEQFLKFAKDNKITFKNAACIEFGCGNGYWGNVLLQLGVKSYTGLDISRTGVENCQKNEPKGSFECIDLGAESYSPKSLSDIAFSIDVIQHVIEENKLRVFLGSMVSAVCQGGYVIVTSYSGFGDKRSEGGNTIPLFGFIKLPRLNFVNLWDIATIETYLTGCRLISTAEFWDKKILLFIKN